MEKRELEKNEEKKIKKEKKINKNEGNTTSKNREKNKRKREVSEEKQSREKVTDINDVQKAAKDKAKKKRILEKKENFRNKWEQVNKKRLKVILIMSAIILSLAIAFGLTMVKNIEIDEGKNYTEDEVKGLVFKNIFDYNTVCLFLKYRYSEQEEIPFLEYIDVQWKDKNSVKIKLYDKNIIGCTNYMNEYIYFDKDGYVVETSQKKQSETPYISGIKFSELTLNKKIDVSNDKIFDTILSVTQQISKYKLDIDEINFDKNYNITLYADDITILLGKKETYDEQLAKLKNMLKEAKDNNLSGVMHMENYKEGQDRIIFDKND